MESEKIEKSSVWTWPLVGLALVVVWLALEYIPDLAFVRAYLAGTWDTWLGFIGLVSGLLVAAYFQWPPMRTALIGFAAGLVVVIVVNVLHPTPASCLQNSKGWDILRAYRLC